MELSQDMIPCKDKYNIVIREIKDKELQKYNIMYDSVLDCIDSNESELYNMNKESLTFEEGIYIVCNFFEMIYDLISEDDCWDEFRNNMHYDEFFEVDFESVREIREYEYLILLIEEEIIKSDTIDISKLNLLKEEYFKKG